MLLSEQISEFYSDTNGLKENKAMELEFNNPYVLKKPMAKLLPILNALFSKKSAPDQFLQQLISFGKLEVLSANVYESYLL